MTKEELAQYELKSISNIVPNWESLPLWQRAVIETAFNLEWWRGFHAPRPVTLDSRECESREVIRLTKAEVQSNMSRVKWAENLILQLPETHDGRNSWLLNYGVGPESDAIRKRNAERRSQR